MGEAIKTRRGRETTSPINPNIFYNNGFENIEVTGGWVGGYTLGNGSISKEADHLKLAVTGNVSGGSERAYVTEIKVDVTDISLLKIDWGCSYTGIYPSSVYSVMAVASNKTANHNNGYSGRVLVYEPFARKIDSINVSALSGTYYIRVHSVWAGGDATDQILKVYKIWGEE